MVSLFLWLGENDACNSVCGYLGLAGVSDSKLREDRKKDSFVVFAEKKFLALRFWRALRLNSHD